MGKGSFTEVRGSADDLESWHAALAGDRAPFLGIEPARDPDGLTGFSGRFRRNVMGRVCTQLTEIKAREHALTRTAEHIRAMPLEPFYMVLFQVAGSSTFRPASGQPARLGPGDYLLYTTRTPCRLEFDGDHVFFSIRFPQSLIDLPEQLLLPLTGRTLSSREGFGKYLAPFVSSVVRDADLLRGPVGGRVVRNLVDLFATGMTELAGRAPACRSVPLFLQVTDYIGHHLADPELDTGAVARASHISTRYLQALFQEQGTTVTDWIRDRRLAGCRRDLADPALREASIGEIAQRWGYPDQAYFSRLFRRSFSESPREWRAQALAARPVG